MSGRRRRTRAEIEAFDAMVCSITRRVHPATCRQIYYRAVVAGIVAKDDRGYRLVCESLSRQRWADEVPWSWIVDETRAIRAPEVWADADAGIAGFAERYRRDAWRDQPVWVEVWCESDSLAGTLVGVTWKLGVPLYSGRGFSSLSALRSAAEQISERYDERRQPTVVLYVGDLDPAGWEASRAAHRGLLRHLDDLSDDFFLELLYGIVDGDKHQSGDLLAEFDEDSIVLGFKRLAVNPENVGDYDLPTGAPPKRLGPGSKSWWKQDGPRLGCTVEAEAFEPDVLRELVRSAILDRADVAALDAVRRTEELEREGLHAVAERGLFTELDRYDGETAQ